MKIKVFVPNNDNFETLRMDGSGFKLTHFKTSTKYFKNEEELEKVIYDEGGILLDLNNSEDLFLEKDTRHGKEGWRGAIYNEDGNWDGFYMFFLSLSEAFQAVDKNDFEKAKEAF